MHTSNAAKKGSDMNAKHAKQPITVPRNENLQKTVFLSARRAQGAFAAFLLSALCAIAVLGITCNQAALAADYKDLSGNGYISLEDAQASCDIRPEHFKALGLDLNPEVPEDVTSPYPEDKVTDVISAREIYAEANGANANRYSVHDNAQLIRSSTSKSALHFVAAGKNPDYGDLDQNKKPPAQGGEVGKTYVVDGSKYQVKSNSKSTVALVKARNEKKVPVRARVTIKGKSYQVTTIADKAFGGNKATSIAIGNSVAKISSNALSGARKVKTVTLGTGVKSIGQNAFATNKALRTLVLKTKKLAKKSSVKNCLKGSRIKIVKVNIGSKKVNRTYVKKYARLFAAKNSGRNVKVK